MKKLIIAALLVAGSFGFANAQTKQKTAPKKPTTAMVAKKSATTPAVKAKGSKTVSAAHLKADGTADKRFKENKTTAKTAGPLKKDGTPDKRYKANKK